MLSRSQNKIPEVAVKPAHGLRASEERGQWLIKAQNARSCVSDHCAVKTGKQNASCENVELHDDNESEVEFVEGRCVKLFVSLHRKRDRAPGRRIANAACDRLLQTSFTCVAKAKQWMRIFDQTTTNDDNTMGLT